MTGAVTCLLADDHPALIAAVSAYLSASGFEIVGPAPDGRRAVELAATARPQVALVDYRMPYLAGVRLVRALREASPATRVAVYTADGDELLAESVLEAGASGIILKEAPLADLLRALETVLSGRTYVDPTLLRETSPRTQLTQRELDVLGLLAEGLHTRRSAIAWASARKPFARTCARRVTGLARQPAPRRSRPRCGEG